jgi:hypothetical protein
LTIVDPSSVEGRAPIPGDLANAAASTSASLIKTEFSLMKVILMVRPKRMPILSVSPRKLSSTRRMKARPSRLRVSAKGELI